MRKIYLHWVLIDSIVETILFYIFLVMFGNNLINNPFSIYSFMVFVIFGVVSYIIYEVVKRHVRGLFY